MMNMVEMGNKMASYDKGIKEEVYGGTMRYKLRTMNEYQLKVTLNAVKRELKKRQKLKKVC